MSCKKQEGIGLDVDPATQVNGTLVVDTSIVATTVPEDSVVTNNLSSRAILAYFKDPELGVTETHIAAVLQLPGATAYTLPTGTITIDSARLILPYARNNAFYGDSLVSSYKIDVHQLNERIVTTKAYYNNNQFDYKPELLGSKTFYARPNDSVQVYNIVKGGPDTLQKIAPHVRIPISTSFINNNFFEASSSTLSSSSIFENTVKGLYITLDKNQMPGIGGNMFFNLDSASVQVYYKRVDGTTIDTTSVSLPLGVTVTGIKHDYSDKVKAALNGTSADGLVYLQGVSGLRAKLTFPDVKKMFASVGDVILNRAELVVTTKPGTTTPFRPAQRLTLYKYDLAHQRVAIQDNSSDPRNSGIIGGGFNSTNGEYHFVVTAFLQDLLSGKTADYGTFLAPADISSSNVTLLPVTDYAERSVIVGKNSPYRIKLNIIYTKIKK
ncbi:DUF4270 family protein [Mucilaginibacter litoreus]|uniref:DUF4270 family protein n=1 Tax=Mucilaginibacter litoreus TaxID=1048221 RepID=A0ABW3AY59_9SPHI